MKKIDMEEILITDAYSRKAMSLVRSLGKKGFNVVALADTRLAPPIWSRFVRHRVICEKDDFGNLKALFAYSQREKIRSIHSQKPILIPLEDDTVEIIIRNSLELARLYDFLLPSLESFLIAREKERTMEFALEIGIEIPETFVYKSSKVRSLSSRKIDFMNSNRDYVVKPIRGSGSRGVRYLSGFELKKYISDHEGKSFLIQERIPDYWESIGVSLLFNRQGKCIQNFCHKRLSEFPISGGPSTSRVSINHEDLLALSIKLMKKLNWVGIAMVEWKINPSTGQYALLEVNPRFWGSLELSVRSNVDFGEQYVKACRNERTTFLVPSLGIRCDWLWPGQILHYLSRPKREKFGLYRFLKSSLKYAEEYDREDKIGFLATIFLSPLLLFKNRYRSLMRR